MNTDPLCLKESFAIKEGLFLNITYLFAPGGYGHVKRIVLHVSQNAPVAPLGPMALKNRLKEGYPFQMPLDAFTPFQKKVYHATMAIGFGATSSYVDIAYKIGVPSPRAVGQALKKNPVPILIPCHRVVNKGGGLGGYSQGLTVKKLLLEFEHEYRCDE